MIADNKTHNGDSIREGVPFEGSPKLDIEELVETIVYAVEERLMERLIPLFDTLHKHETSGVLKGTKAINRYMGLGPKYLGNNSTMKKWFTEYGFPVVKDHNNRWWTTKSLIDKWVFENSVLMRMAIKLGYLSPRHNFYRKYFSPHWLTEEQRDECQREWVRERIKLGMSV